MFRMRADDANQRGEMSGTSDASPQGVTRSLGAIIFRTLFRPLRGLSAEVQQGTIGDLAKPSTKPMPAGTELAELHASLTAMRTNLANETELRRAASQQVEHLAAERDRAEAKSQARAEFLAVMSHEIRTPLNAIIGFTQLGLEDQPSEPHAGRLRNIRSASEALLHVVNDILDFSKIDAGHLVVEVESYRMEDVLERLRILFTESVSSAGLRFEVTRDATLPPVLLGDASRLSQVLTNLVGNAVKFTSVGSVDVHAGWRDDRLTIRIKDTGIGMDEAAQNKLFQPFTQADANTSRQYGGTGLGLVISKKILEAMGGRITVSSRPGRGTTMVIAVLAPKGTESVTRPAPVIGLDELSILVVDDNELNRVIARELLAKRGATVTCAASGAEALAFLAGPLACDAVLMDIQMPGMDGCEATQRLRLLPGRERLPVIAFTAHAFAEERERCLAAGMDEHIGKPIDVKKLTQTLNNLVGDKPRASSRSHHQVQLSATTKPITVVPAQMENPVLDRAQLLAELEDPVLVDEMIALFLTTADASLATIAEDCARGDFVAAGKEAHKTKGMALSVRARACAEAMLVIEIALKAGTQPDVEAARSTVRMVRQEVSAPARLVTGDR